MTNTKQTLKRSIRTLLAGAAAIAVSGAVYADAFTYKEPDASTEQMRKLDEQIQTLQSRLVEAETLLLELTRVDMEPVRPQGVDAYSDLGNIVSSAEMPKAAGDLDPEGRAALSEQLDDRYRFLGRVGNKNLVRKGGEGGEVLTLSDAEYQSVRATETVLITRSLLNSVLQEPEKGATTKAPTPREGLEARRNSSGSRGSK